GRAEEMSYLAEGLAHRGLTTLVGSAGIGKTTLAREALERRRYVEGGALRSLRWRPYLPFERALSRAFTGEPDEVADEVISRAGDAVLFIDDLHWADERCIAALDLVIAHLTVVATARDAELDARANTLVGKGRRIDVRALADTDARRLAHRLHPDLVDTVIEELLAVANGNPLLLEVLADEEAPSRTLLD